MYILGIYNSHNSTASLFKDGKIIACASEERFVGVKNYIGFPKNAIKYVLDEGKIRPEDLDLVTTPFLYRSPYYVSAKNDKDIFFILLSIMFLPVGIARKIFGNIAFYIPWLSYFGRLIFNLSAVTIGRLTIEKEKKFIANYLGISKNKVLSFDHHLSHAAAGYYSSKFNNKKTLVLTADGEGDMYSASVNVFNREKINVISKTPREHSFGWIYALVTEFLGMKVNEHEYKVMGLAAYAKEADVDKYWNKVKNIASVDSKRLIFHTSFSTLQTRKFIDKYLKNVRFDIIAALFQRLTEEKITLWVKESIKKTKISTVVLSGGVFMNVKLNQKIMELPEVKEIFILPSCGDESNVIGSSYLAYRDYCKKQHKKLDIKPIKDLYWGPEFDNQKIGKFIKLNHLNNKFIIKKVKNIEREIAKLISRGEVVARLSGKMEFGARALGNRSILADPRNIDVVRLINEQVKNRDFWMPFAPSILYGKQNKYLLNLNKGNYDAFYMMMTFNTTEKGKKDLKAAMHQYDFTVRPQIVKKEYSPSYYTLIKEFEKITGVSAVLNTSFNLHGFPIVLGPQEAMDAFANSGLSYLSLGNYLIMKKQKNRSNLL